MTSESEHTNRQRSPQQAQGRQWPILVLLLGLAALALALTACGGPSSTSTPDATSATRVPSTSTPGATTGSPPTATSPPASTPTPKPTEAAEVGESTGTIRETREYLEAFCALQQALQPAEQGPATWGEVADRGQKVIDFVEKNEPPEELRDFAEAYVATDQLIVRFAKEHRSLSYEDEEAWNEYRNGPEMAEAKRNFGSAYIALDAAVQDAMPVSC